MATPVGTNYEKPTEAPSDTGEYNRFDRVKFYVGNAKQAAHWYCTTMGFTPWMYKGLETGSRDYVSHVIKQEGNYEEMGDTRVVFEFVSPLKPNDETFSKQHSRHGDFVKDLGFDVSNIEDIVSAAEKAGATVIQQVQEETDKDGTLKTAILKTYGDVEHTLFDRSNYRGEYQPGYKPAPYVPKNLAKLPPVGLLFVDHCVGNQPWEQMDNVCDWYAKSLKFHKFWSVDDSQMHTEYSALSSVVMTNFNETIKMPINEPAKGMRKSQIEEYCDYNDGAGVQHIAIRTTNILYTIETMMERGVQFLQPPLNYYDDLQIRLESLDMIGDKSTKKNKVVEPMDALRRLRILCDFDENGYLLQLFTKPVQDRPTLFIEVIERHDFSGFGAGNFKALFKAIEDDQAARGNLTKTE